MSKHFLLNKLNFDLYVAVHLLLQCMLLIHAIPNMFFLSLRNNPLRNTFTSKQCDLSIFEILFS